MYRHLELILKLSFGVFIEAPSNGFSNKLLANPVITEEVRMGVAEAIGMLGETKASVEKLRDLWRFYERQDPLHASVLVAIIYQALWAVSRRAGVIIVRVGNDYKVFERGCMKNSFSN